MSRHAYLFGQAAAASALATVCHADDGSAGAVGAGTPPAPAVSVAEFEFPQFAEGTKHSFDCALIPAETRLDFLKGAVRSYIANRLNGVHTRHQKDEQVIAWNEYDAATKADPLQSVVAKPEGDRPTEPDYQEAYDRAIADLIAGNVRKQSAEPKARKTKDPLTSVVTEAVVREVYDSRRATNPKYSFLEAKKEVGGDGIAYLNRLIDAKVEGGGDRGALEKMRDTRYVNPAKAMLGITTTKAVGELPSIL